MTRKRLTREESRDQTRQRLLQSAQKLIAGKGLAAASVEDITEAAGYTRGAFYSNFDSKNDLFIELLRADHQKAVDEMSALMSQPLPPEELRHRIREMYTGLYRDNECFMNWTEARMLATRDASFQTKLSALLVEKRGQVSAIIAHFYQLAGATPPTSPEVMAMGFMSLVEGVKLFMLSSPKDMSMDDAETILSLFVDSIMELAIIKSQPAAAHPAG
ncbi:TetR/AcrR family transcriptional regulator [Silvimonas iriomotensis]|uniref:TetR family transcriptional regulator n=1 Tax=Silvimonas iriomotensis TaxID=449662 RepID=A0ABQ2P9G9_9NEIS|nr:TetR/AcrR family transcriptional regulator [Silvimonas iriomotensis]GGP21017.1 TetR family transcriptional regulator [Silvimonas iriomotensis]